jgi:RND family efflux transporter MFP subunit
MGAAMPVTLGRLIVMAAMLALVAACSNEAPPRNDARPVKTLVVAVAAVSDLGSVTGEIRARTETDVGFRIGGKILQRPVDVGTTVAQDTVLARLDDTNEKNSVRIAESQLNAAKAELADATGNEARQRELLEKGFTTQANYDAASRRLKTAQANVAGAEASLRDAQDRLSYTVLHADAAGVITAVSGQPGQVVSAGQMVVRLARLGEKEGVFNVAEQMFRNVPRDPLVEVSLLSDPTVKANGRVREVSPSADPVTRTFMVRIALQDPPEQMRLGSAVVGRVILESQRVATLPPPALFKNGDKPAVWLVDPDQLTVFLRDVTVLRYENDRVLISAGLATGDRVVVAGVHKLRPGMKVRLAEDAR